MPIDPFTALNAMLRAEAARNALPSADALRDAAPDGVGGKPRRDEQAEPGRESGQESGRVSDRASGQVSGQVSGPVSGRVSGRDSGAESESGRAVSASSSTAPGLSARERSERSASRTRS